MEVTIVKHFNGVEAVKVSQVVTSLEDLIIFSSKVGYTQPLEEYVQDFQNFKNVTYRMGLNHE